MSNVQRIQLKNFGIVMGTAFLAVSGILLFKHKENIFPLGVSALFFSAALIAPALLNPLYIVWMKLAHYLSLINTKLILILLYFLIFTPLNFLMKLLGLDLLKRNEGREAKTYWRQKESRDGTKTSYEKQF